MQPHLATGGTAFAPADLTSGPVLGRVLALPRRAVAALRSRWEPTVVVPADPRAVEERRPEYEVLLAEGTDRFLEPRVDRCPWCGSLAIEELLTTPDLSQHKPGTFTLDRCDSCDVVFQNPRLTPEGLAFYYRDFYDGLGADALDLAFSTVEPSYRGRVQMVQAEDPAPSRWLDVGGGHGHFCLIAAEDLPDTRFDLIDQSDAALDAARRGWVAEAHDGAFVELADGLAGTYDVVSMHHYLEHTRDPRAELAAARTALAPGGHLLIEVPDPERSWARRAGRYWGPWLQPQHLQFLPIDGLCAELARQGFTVVARERGEAHQPVDYSSFVGMLSQDLAPKPDKPWLPRSSSAQRAGRLAVLGASLPFLAVAYVADLVLAPLRTDRPGSSNTYRVLARRD
ncbi:MAG: class I SAM-dependent methyltransferase [Acidimicrobiales bacterium]